MSMIKWKLVQLKVLQSELKSAEDTVDNLRDAKWKLVKELKESGHDFTATTEGMDIVLSSSPSFNWS